MRLLFETYENEAMDPPTPCNEAKTPRCKRYNPAMELTTVRARVGRLLLVYRRYIPDLERSRL